MAYETEKQNAAAAAMEFVEDGMTIGLGTGSTAKYFVELLADEIADGLIVRCIETSVQTRDLARSLGVPLIPFEQVDRIHLTVDGADEAGPGGVLIKGGGAALLREKIIAEASDQMVVITDPSKQVEHLGRFALPVEINGFGAELTRRRIHWRMADAGMPAATSSWRMATAESLLHTDGGHLILDLACGVIADPIELSVVLDDLPGVVEHGLFIGMADRVIVGEDAGARFVDPR